MGKKTRFKDKNLQGIYELGLTATYPLDTNFYTGKLRGGLGSAWTNGYKELKGNYVRTSVAYAAYVAGKKVKEIEVSKMITV